MEPRSKIIEEELAKDPEQKPLVEAINKEGLVGVNFLPKNLTNENIGEHGYYKTWYITLLDDTDRKFFISSGGALDNEKVVNHLSTLSKRESEGGNEYYIFASPVKDME